MEQKIVPCKAPGGCVALSTGDVYLYKIDGKWVQKPVCVVHAKHPYHKVGS